MTRKLNFARHWLLNCALLASYGAWAALPDLAAGGAVPSLAPMLERITPAVVNISTQGHVQLQTNPLFNDPFFRRFFNVPNAPQERKTQSLGSGVIVDARRGLVATNNHVIANADQIMVRLNDGREFEAKLVGADPETDVAVVQIKGTNLIALPMANSDRLRVGDFAVAIGNPFGLGQTVTSGIISALARSGLGITGYEDLIQTDASINPGNSGGALVNLNGELIGINTAIYSQSGGNIGIGFAIPINMANQVIDQLVKFGEVNRGFLGAEMQNLTPDLAAAFGISNVHGAVLVSVISGSPAEQAGLRAGDVVTTVNGKQVRDASDLRNQVGLMRVGDVLNLDVLRDGKRQRVNATIGSRQVASTSNGIKSVRLAGVSVGDIPEDSPGYGRLFGVMVYEISQRSRAFAAGLRVGDIITAVNRQPIENLRMFVETVTQIQGQLLLRVQRGNQGAFLVIK
ncbi:MAG: DegQ family serine endoprotease [Gammaproteobacteria bacterium]|nr:DegQ family serine endoprotease [Gammaproteobacteria bacterium]